MKNRGFTLIELLAVIAILAIIMLIATPRVLDAIESSRIKAYQQDEQMMVKATETYFGNNVDQLPENIGETVEVTLSNLKTNKFISEINDCDGYVLVTKTEDGYSYNPHLKCGDSNKIGDSVADGLVLNYTFDMFQEGTTNEYNYPTFDTADSTGGWSHWPRPGAVGTYNQTTEQNYIYGDQTYSHWINNDITGTDAYLLYQVPTFEGGYRSLSAIIKMSDGSEVTNTKVFPAWNASTPQSIPGYNWTSIEDLGDGFYLCKAEGINQDGSDDLVGIFVNQGYRAYFSRVQLERHDYATPFVEGTRVSNIIDYSGKNLATGILGATTSPTWKKEGTNGYYEFDGVDDYISIDNHSFINETEGTIIINFKVATDGTGEQVIFVGGSDVSGANLIAGEDKFILSYNADARTLYGGWKTLNEADLALYGVSITPDKWYNLVIGWSVSENSSYAYIDNVKTVGDVFTLNNKNLWTEGFMIGRSKMGAATPDYFKGSIGDIKIYNRALSAEEIKYQYDTTRNLYE